MIGSYVLLGAIPVMAGWLLVTRGTTTTAAPRTPAAVAPPTAQPAAGGACNVPATDPGAGLQSVPPDLTWSVSNGDLTPTSPTAGPMVVQGGVARCFADDAEGALIAAVRIPQQIAGATAPTWPAAAQGLAAGPYTQPFERQVVSLLAQPAPPADTAQPFAAVAGFKFVSWSPSTSVIELVYRTQGGVLYAADETLQWVGSDWRIALLGPDELSSPLAVVPDLLGYVEWRQP